MNSPKPLHLLSVAVAAIAISLLFSATAGAALAPKGGKVFACYKVKGKSKGALRLVATKQRCKRGERKLTWSTASSSQSGPTGSPGATGAQGPAGAKGDSGAEGKTPELGEFALKSEIVSLNLKLGQLEPKLASLESTVTGLATNVSNLTTGLGNVEGTVAGLLSELPVLKGTVATLDSTVATLGTQAKGLCTQATTLTSQSNLLGTSLGSIKVIGGLIELELPKVTPLKPFSC